MSSIRLRNTVRIGAAVGLIIAVPMAGYLAARLNRVLRGQHLRADDQQCLDNLRLLGQAMATYAFDWGDRLPPAEAWADRLAPLVGGDRAFHCPADPKPEPHSYALHGELARGRLGDVLHPGEVPAIYDSDRGLWNARDPYPELPSPPRHGKSNNSLMADGSVRSLSPYDVWRGAEFQAAAPESPEVEPLPEYRGPSLLYDTGPPLGFRFEYPATWSVTASSEGITLTGDEPGGAVVRLTIAEGKASPAQVLKPTAQVDRRYSTDLAPEPGGFPAVCPVLEYTDGGRRGVALMIPTRPPLLYQGEVKAESWDDTRTALLLAATTLRSSEVRGPEEADG